MLSNKLGVNTTIFEQLTLDKRTTMTENYMSNVFNFKFDFANQLSNESVLMFIFTFLAAGILIVCLVSILCYNCVFYYQEDDQWNPTPISDLEKETPRLHLNKIQLV
jgi:hypothetical protein